MPFLHLKWQLHSWGLWGLAGFPGGSVASAGDGGWSLCQEDALEKERQPTPGFLPGKSHGQRSLWAAVRGVAKSQTGLSDQTATAGPYRTGGAAGARCPTPAPVPLQGTVSLLIRLLSVPGPEVPVLWGECFLRAGRLAAWSNLCPAASFLPVGTVSLHIPAPWVPSLLRCPVSRGFSCPYCPRRVGCRTPLRALGTSSAGPFLIPCRRSSVSFGSGENQGVLRI